MCLVSIDGTLADQFLHNEPKYGCERILYEGFQSTARWQINSYKRTKKLLGSVWCKGSFNRRHAGRSILTTRFFFITRQITKEQFQSTARWQINSYLEKLSPSKRNSTLESFNRRHAGRSILTVIT